MLVGESGGGCDVEVVFEDMNLSDDILSRCCIGFLLVMLGFMWMVDILYLLIGYLKRVKSVVDLDVRLKLRLMKVKSLRVIELFFDFFIMIINLYFRVMMIVLRSSVLVV